MELDMLPSTVITPPAVTLNFDLLIPKANQHIDEPKNIVSKIWGNSLQWFSSNGVHDVFGSLPAVTLTFYLLPQTVSSASMDPNTYVTKIG